MAQFCMVNITSYEIIHYFAAAIHHVYRELCAAILNF